MLGASLLAQILQAQFPLKIHAKGIKALEREAAILDINWGYVTGNASDIP